jgi:hypothetical protein
MRSAALTVFLTAFVSTTLACASNPKPSTSGDQKTPVKNPSPPAAPDPQDEEPRHGEISFPRPEHETCTPRARTPYRLTVRVKDDGGQAFPDAQVHLFPMGAGHETLVSVKTDKGGVANVVVNPPGVYAVAVAVGGFEPQIRGLRMRPGCGGTTTFTLKLGPVAGQK